MAIGWVFNNIQGNYAVIILAVIFTICAYVCMLIVNKHVRYIYLFIMLYAWLFKLSQYNCDSYSIVGLWMHISNFVMAQASSTILVSVFFESSYIPTCIYNIIIYIYKNKNMLHGGKGM